MGCKTHKQMDTFPTVLGESIDHLEVDMLSFPVSVKGIKTWVFFVCPTQGNMEKLQQRFQDHPEGFDCKLMAAKPPPKENLNTELKKRGWQCTECSFLNLEGRDPCYQCRRNKPLSRKNNSANAAIPRPHTILDAWKRELAVTVCNG